MLLATQWAGVTIVNLLEHDPDLMGGNLIYTCPTIESATWQGVPKSSYIRSNTVESKEMHLLIPF